MVKKFTHMQIGVAGVVGSPLASAALVSWNLACYYGGVAGGLFLSFFSFFLLLGDTMAGIIGSEILGLFGFVLSILAAMLVNFIASPANDELPSQEWGILVPVIFGFALIFAMFRYWVAKFISFPLAY